MSADGTHEDDKETKSGQTLVTPAYATKSVRQGSGRFPGRLLSTITRWTRTYLPRNRTRGIDSRASTSRGEPRRLFSTLVSWPDLEPERQTTLFRRAQQSVYASADHCTNES